MEDLVERLARGNVTEVKVMLTSVALALAAYQLVLVSVGYRKLRPRFLEPGPAAKAHRASGDAILVLRDLADRELVSVSSRAAVTTSASSVILSR